MRLITIEEQIAVVENVHKANIWLATAYPDTMRQVTVKISRWEVAVYIHDKDLKVAQYLIVEALEFNSTVEHDLRQVHAALDAIIQECDEMRIDRFAGAVEAVGA